MSNALRRLRLLTPLLLMLPTGCATAYHSYCGCRVPCRYCAPPPLPYPHFGPCVCHSHVAVRYVALPSAPSKPAAKAVLSEPEPK